jgi:uncharacterized protein involved in exopolysaccharide biosynthesis
MSDDVDASGRFTVAAPGPGWTELIAQRWKLLVTLPLAAGAFAVAISFMLPRTYLSRTLFVPPQQQGSAAAALAQLGPLSGLLGSAGGLKTPADQYVSLLSSASVADKLIEEFDLMKVYEVEFRDQARDRLSDNTRISLGRKDGLIAIEVEDRSPQRAAQIANRYVDELRRLTARLALTEAQQRRALFEGELKATRDRLTRAQIALQETGFSQSAIRTDARAAAEGYARLRAETTSAEVRVQALRRTLADSAPEVQQALAVLGALRAQLARVEGTADFSGAPDYVTKFREYKYQETLFELLARQFEAARLDEAREGTLIQVVDVAQPAERKHRPRRLLLGVVTWLAASLSVASFLVVRNALSQRRRPAR